MFAKREGLLVVVMNELWENRTAIAVFHECYD